MMRRPARSALFPYTTLFRSMPVVPVIVPEMLQVGAEAAKLMPATFAPFTVTAAVAGLEGHPGLARGIRCQPFSRAGKTELSGLSVRLSADCRPPGATACLDVQLSRPGKN